MRVTFSGFRIHRRVTAHELGQCCIILITNGDLVVYRQFRVIPSSGLPSSVSVLVGRGWEGERGGVFQKWKTLMSTPLSLGNNRHGSNNMRSYDSQQCNIGEQKHVFVRML